MTNRIRVDMKQLTCTHCSKDFEASRATTLYCSTPCKHMAKHMRQSASGIMAAKLTRKYKRERTTDKVKAYPAGSSCMAEGCEREPHGSSLCKMHYRSKARALGLVNSPSDVWTELRKANKSRRNAIIRGAVTSELIDYQVVFNRDDYMCGICGTQVDRNLTYPHPMSASLDHILALSRGGAHAYLNAQCAHLTCNLVKGNRTPSLTS